MKKAQLKELRRMIATLPQIPILKDGRTKTSLVMFSGSLTRASGILKDDKGNPISNDYAYGNHEKGNYVNKEKFFIEGMKKGVDPQVLVDQWNEKYQKVQELIASYVPPEKEPEKEKSVEQLKQEVADEWQKIENLKSKSDRYR